MYQSKKFLVTNKYGNETYVWLQGELPNAGIVAICSSINKEDLRPYTLALIHLDGSISVFPSGELKINKV